jgi:hypothetical protein
MQVNCSDRKKPPTKRTASRILIGVLAVKNAGAAINTPLAIAFTSRTFRNPNRFRIVPAAVFIPIAPSAVTNVNKPEFNGVIPKPS